MFGASVNLYKSICPSLNEVHVVDFTHTLKNLLWKWLTFFVHHCEFLVSHSVSAPESVYRGVALVGIGIVTALFFSHLLFLPPSLSLADFKNTWHICWMLASVTSRKDLIIAARKRTIKKKSAVLWHNLFNVWEKNKDTNQPAHPHNLISTLIAWVVQSSEKVASLQPAGVTL